MDDNLIGKIVVDSLAYDESYKGIVIYKDLEGRINSSGNLYLTYVPDEAYHGSHRGDPYNADEIEIIDKVLRKYCKTTYKEAREKRRFWYAYDSNMTVIGSAKTCKKSNR